MSYPPPYRPDRRSDHASQGDPRRVARWLLGLIGSMALFGALGVTALYQVTAEEPAKDSLRRATAALTEIDALLARHEDTLRTAAEEAEAGEMLQLQDYPIALGLTAEDVTERSHDELRTLILDRSVDRLYEDGTGALRESAEGRGRIGTFSVAGITDRGLGTLTSDNHTMFGILAAVLLAGAAGLTIATAAACRGWGRLSAAGIVLVLGGAATLAMGGIVSLSAGASASGEDDYARAELYRVLEELAMAPVLAGTACLAAGIVVTGVALFAGVASRAEAPARAAEAG